MHDEGWARLTIVSRAGDCHKLAALNHGSGELYIKTTGMVTGSGVYGINGVNYGGTSLTINAASVTGAVTGIGGDNTRGSGLLSITSTGTAGLRTQVNDEEGMRHSTFFRRRQIPEARSRGAMRTAELHVWRVF